MSRYIDADALKDRLDYCVKEGMGSTIAFTFKHMVEEAPSIDIEPKRGEWKAETKNFHSNWICSECGGWALLEYNEQMCLSNFCPNCGADMREREGE